MNERVADSNSSRVVFVISTKEFSDQNTELQMKKTANLSADQNFHWFRHWSV